MRNHIFITLALVAANLGCNKIDDAINESNAVALDTVDATGIEVSSITLKPSKTSLGSKKDAKEKLQLRLTLSGKVTQAQSPKAHIATRLACEVGDKTMGDAWLSFLPLGKKAAGDAFDREVALHLPFAIDTDYKKCELAFAHLERPANFASKVSSVTPLGKLCYLDGKLKKGACPDGTLTRKAKGETPVVVDVAGHFDLNPPAGKGGLNPPPGKPRQKYRFQFHHLLQRGTVPFPADGHRIDGLCTTSVGVQEKGIGYPSQGNSVDPGEWLSLDHSWYFMDEPTACELVWRLGGGSLTPNAKPSTTQEFARYCATKTGLTEGACKPAIVAPAKSAAPSASAAPATSASATPAASASAGPAASASAAPAK